MKHGFAILALALSAVACAPGEGDVAVDENRLPASWDLESIRTFVRNLEPIKTRENEIALRVLAWKIEEGEAPQRVDSGIVWVRYTVDRNEDWLLAHLIRETDGRGTGDWHLAVWKGTPQVSHRYYEHAPSAEEAARFMRATWWTDAANAGRRLADSSICKGNWLEVVGSLPPGL